MESFSSTEKTKNKKKVRVGYLLGDDMFYNALSRYAILLLSGSVDAA